jgi:small GTP-binding protein
MGGGSSTEYVYVPQYVYVPDPAAQKAVEELKVQLQKVADEASTAGDPALFTQNSNKIMDNLLSKLPNMKLNQSIVVQTGEVHIGVVGNISVGKTTLLNALLNLNLPVSMDHCTEGCQVVHQQNSHIYWDVAGKNDDFKFYNPESLSFVKSLGIAVVLYSDDIALSANLIRVVSKINPNVILVRTKVDGYRANDVRSIEQIRARDTSIAKTWIENPQIYFVSAHNIMDGKERYDWDAIEKLLK